FLIPYVFIIQPALLLQGTWQDMLSALVTLCLGMVGVAAGMAGYFFGVTNVVERVLLVAGGIALVYPALLISLIGLVVLISVAILQKLRKAETSDQIAHRNGQATPAAWRASAPCSRVATSGWGGLVADWGIRGRRQGRAIVRRRGRSPAGGTPVAGRGPGRQCAEAARRPARKRMLWCLHSR